MTKEELDKCSTCDLCAAANDDLPESSKEQLKARSGAEITEGDMEKKVK